MESPSLQILQSVNDGDVLLLVSESILNEYADVLPRTRLKMSTDRIVTLLQAIADTAEEIRPSTRVQLTDPDDEKFLECALDGGGYLVTGNKADFPD